MTDEQQIRALIQAWASAAHEATSTACWRITHLRS